MRKCNKFLLALCALGALCSQLAGCAEKRRPAVTVTRIIPKECILSDIQCMNDECTLIRFVRRKGCEVLNVAPAPPPPASAAADPAPAPQR